MLLCMQPELTVDILDFDKLSTVAESASLSPVRSTSLLAVRVLVDVSSKFKRSRDMAFLSLRPSPITSRVVSQIFDRIIFLVKQLFDPCHTDSVVFQEVKSLFKLLSMVREHLDLAVTVLDQIFVLVRCLSNMKDSVMSTAKLDSLVHENTNTDGGKSTVIRRKLACEVYSFLVAYLEYLSEAGAITMLIFEKVKLLVEHIWECKLFDSYTRSIFSLLLHSSLIWGKISQESCRLNGKLGILLHNYSIEHELITLEFAKKVMEENKYWPAYKAGMYSACQGAWFICTFIFQQLITKVRSDSCGCWIKSLFQFALSESKIMLLHLTTQDSSFTDRSKTIKLSLKLLCNDPEEMDHDGTNALCEPNCNKVLRSAYNSICSAKETLEADVISGQAFRFQRWFLSLQAKALRAVVDVLETLESIQCLWGNGSCNGLVGKSFMVECVLSLEKLAQMSMQLTMLAKEFDLFNVSFMDIDSKSSKVISALALSSSLLAFIAGFALFIPNQRETFSCDLKNTHNKLCAHLIQILAGRLCHIDHEISSKFIQLLDVSEYVTISCSHLQFGSQAFNIACEGRDVLGLCSYAVSELARLRSEAYTMDNEEENTARVIKDGLQLTLKILTKWTQIPLWIPKYFFQSR